jgi:hypothetical protein
VQAIVALPQAQHRATIACTQTVIGNLMATVQTINDSAKNGRQNANPSQN